MRAWRVGCWALILLISRTAQVDAGQLRRNAGRESSSKGGKLPKARKVKLPMDLTGDVYFLNPDTLKLPDFSKMTAVASIRVKSLNVAQRDYTEGFPGVKDRVEFIGIDFHGTVTIEKQGTYVFVLTSDDGAKLFINDELLIDNDGVHDPRSQEAEMDLAPGTYRIRVPYFQGPRQTLALVLEVYRVGE